VSLPSLPSGLWWLGAAVPPLVFGAVTSYLVYRHVATDGGRTRELERRVAELESEVTRLRDGDARTDDGATDSATTDAPPKG
jgi:hypothetical protein